jgi:hypothetical protein
VERIEHVLVAGEDEATRTRLHAEDVDLRLFQKPEDLASMLHPGMRGGELDDIPPRNKGHQYQNKQRSGESQDDFSFEGELHAAYPKRPFTSREDNRAKFANPNDRGERF